MTPPHRLALPPRLPSCSSGSESSLYFAVTKKQTAAAAAAVQATFQMLLEEKRSIKETSVVKQMPGSDTAELFISDHRLTSRVCQIGKRDAHGQVVNFVFLVSFWVAFFLFYFWLLFFEWQKVPPPMNIKGTLLPLFIAQLF